MDIDLSVVPFSDLNSNVTEVLQREYMEDYDKTSKSSQKLRASDERVQNIRGEVKYSDSTISVSIVADGIPDDPNSTWRQNSMTILRSLLPGWIYGLVASCKSMLTGQIKDYVMPMLGGALA